MSSCNGLLVTHLFQAFYCHLVAGLVAQRVGSTSSENSVKRIVDGLDLTKRKKVIVRWQKLDGMSLPLHTLE